ncbi:MAG: hypothetical protein ACTSYD_02580 [Candidatus Heimdallarchaeaceae archaeon]
MNFKQLYYELKFQLKYLKMRLTGEEVRISKEQAEGLMEMWEKRGKRWWK